MVTAGFRCAPGLPQAIAVKTPHITAKAHAEVMTIQPAFSAFVFLRSTLATTPSPSRIRTMVPRNSPSQGEVIRRASKIAPCILEHIHLGGADILRESAEQKKRPGVSPGLFRTSL